jgi:hypothetical protein
MFHFEGLQEDNPRQVDLIRTDLDVALTLVQVARQTREGAKASRSRRNARKAYDAIIRYVGGPI